MLIQDRLMRARMEAEAAKQKELMDYGDVIESRQIQLRTLMLLADNPKMSFHLRNANLADVPLISPEVKSAAEQSKKYVADAVNKLSPIVGGILSGKFPNAKTPEEAEKMLSYFIENYDMPQTQAAIEEAGRNLRSQKEFEMSEAGRTISAQRLGWEQYKDYKDDMISMIDKAASFVIGQRTKPAEGVDSGSMSRMMLLFSEPGAELNPLDKADQGFVLSSLNNLKIKVINNQPITTAELRQISDAYNISKISGSAGGPGEAETTAGIPGPGAQRPVAPGFTRAETGVSPMEGVQSDREVRDRELRKYTQYFLDMVVPNFNELDSQAKDYWLKTASEEAAKWIEELYPQKGQGEEQREGQAVKKKK
jgi:hypothetical protein